MKNNKNFEFLEFQTGENIETNKHNKNSRKNKIKLSRDEYQKTKLLLKLFRFINVKEEDLIGWQYISSSSFLNNNISYEIFLEELNSENSCICYTPSINDMVKIELEYIYPEINKKPRPYIGNYISFIYKDKWMLNNGFDHIDNLYELILEGELKI